MKIEPPANDAFKRDAISREAHIRRIRWKAAFAAVFALAGCQSLIESDIPTPASAFTALNTRFAGRDIEEVVARYGLPDEQTTYRGLRLLLWHTSSTLQFREPVTTTTTGRIGDPSRAPWAQVPYTETTTSTRTVGQDYACTMRVGVRDDGTVDGVDMVGKMGACQNFMP